MRFVDARSARVALVAVVALLAVAAFVARGHDPLRATVDVRRGDLVLSVDVEGELSAVRSIDVGPPVVREMWEYKITYLAPESAAVRKGQPLVSFDGTPLMRQLEHKRAEFQEASTRIERKDLELAGMRRDLELQVAEAESRLAKARLKNEVPEELRARNDVLKTGLELKDAEQALVNLRGRIAALREAQALSLRALGSQRDGARARVAELEAAIAAMTVRASQDGIVVYKTGWRGEKKKVGDSTYFGETLLGLPDLSAMRADGEVDEADAGAVALGQHVTFRLEALPDRDHGGVVTRIARAVRRKSPRVPSKVFRVQIGLDQAEAALRPAMRFRGEIETGRVTGALLVPREAVFLRPSGPVVWAKRWSGFREAPFTAGRRNKRFVEVLGGLAAGEEVCTRDLAPESRP